MNRHFDWGKAENKKLKAGMGKRNRKGLNCWVLISAFCFLLSTFCFGGLVVGPGTSLTGSNNWTGPNWFTGPVVVGTASGVLVNTGSGTRAAVPGSDYVTSGTGTIQAVQVFNGARKYLQVAAMTDRNYESSSSGVTTGMSRCGYLSPTAFAIRDLRLTYNNSSGQVNGVDGPGANAITMRGSIEYPAGTFYPVYFNGQRTITLDPGAEVTSDPVAVDIPAGTQYWSRNYVTVTDTSKSWPQGFIVDSPNLTGTAISGARTTGTNIADLTTSGSMADGFGYAWGPCAISGIRADGGKQTAVGIIGDSIAVGPNPGQSSYASYHTSYLTRSLGGAGIPFVQAAQGGQTVAYEAINYPVLNSVANNCTHAIVTVGINDIKAWGATGTNNVPSVQANYVKLWTELSERGLKVYQTTITPNTSSTDSWCTAGGQTIIAGQSLTAVNDWIRTTPAPLSGYFEIADVVMPSRNANIWITNGTAQFYTQDGLHPYSGCGPLMKAVIDAAIAAGKFTQ